MEDISSKSTPELEAYLKDLGEKPFRARQVYKWLHEGLATDFSQMSDLPLSLRERLLEEAYITAPEPVEVQRSVDGTRKYLLRLCDDSLVEAVLMRYHFGLSVCISSQVGCRMGCAFCASGIGGLVRGLTSGEMLGEVETIQREIFAESLGGVPKAGSEEYNRNRISHVVVMGTGEPLDNYEALLGFIRMLTDKTGLHLSQRSVTVSTCGLVPMIGRLSKEDLEITLALSLHAPTQEKRERLMPIAHRYGLEETVEAMKDYQEATGRRVTFEYALIAGVNDTDEDARELSGLLWSGAHLNLIPVNPVKERSFAAPTREAAMAFQRKLEKFRINVTIRREMGQDIDGACGQLRRRRLER